MNDIETRLQRIEAQLSGQPAKRRKQGPKPDLIPSLYGAFGVGWFTSQQAGAVADIASIVGSAHPTPIGRALMALRGLTHMGHKLTVGATNGQRRFRLEPVSGAPVLILTAYGPVCSGKSHLLRRIVEALGAEYRFNLDVERNTLSVRQMCINGVWRDGI